MRQRRYRILMNGRTIAFAHYYDVAARIAESLKTKPDRFVQIIDTRTDRVEEIE